MISLSILKRSPAKAGKLAGPLAIVAVCSLTGSCYSAKSSCEFDQTRIGLKKGIRANAGCIVIRDQKLLVIESRERAVSVPGGAKRMGESAACTAIRETKEETGLEVLPVELTKVWDNGFYLFECNAENTATHIRQPREVSAIHWLDIQSFENHEWRFPQQRDWLKDYLASEGRE